MTAVTIPAAFLAGLVSFLSPCVLPLVPGYLSYMSGMSTTEDATTRGLKTGLVALGFVGGFTAVFVALGATATLLGSWLLAHREGLSQIGGLVIIFLGLTFIGAIRVPWLYRERRFHPRPGAGVWGSVILGGAFAFGWSPCIGVTLGVALTMAAGSAESGGPAQGALLLAVYSLGLGVPFIVAGLGVSHLTRAMAYLRRHARAINLASGALLMLVGLMFLTGQMFRFSIWMQSFTQRNFEFLTRF